MAVMKLRRLNEDSAGVTIPKDDLRLEGLIEDDELVATEHVEVTRIDDGEWRIRRLDDFPGE